MTRQRRHQVYQRDFKRTTGFLGSDGNVFETVLSAPDRISGALRTFLRRVTSNPRYQTLPPVLRGIVNAELRGAASQCSLSCSSLVEETEAVRAGGGSARDYDEYLASRDRLDAIKKRARDVAFGFSRALFVLSFVVWDFLYALARKRPERNPRPIAICWIEPPALAWDLPPETGPPHRLHRLVSRLKNRAPPALLLLGAAAERVQRYVALA